LSAKEREARLAKLPARPWDEHWFDLAGSDAQKAYQAIWGLVAKGKETETRLPEQLAQIIAIPIADRIADLGDNNIKRRTAAEQDLARLGSLADAALHRALQGDLDPRARRWIERHLALRETGQITGPDEGLRTLRTIEVLEHLATPKALEILQALAKQAAAPAAEVARATLNRLRTIVKKEK
jgi:hypothetical protein